MTQTNLEDHLATFGSTELVPLTNFQKVVARRLSASWSQIPHVTHNDEIDVTAVEAFRNSLGTKLSPLVFLIKAMAGALAAFPNFNASLSEDGKTLILKKYFNVAVAVDGPLGLLVPVLRDVDRATVSEIAAQLKKVSTQAREKGLPVSAMSGGSITISSLGGIGGTGFTPIINQPEVAILGVTPSRMAPVWDGHAFAAKMMMPLSLSYDHRVINGADAARFVRKLGELMKQPDAL